LAQQGYGAVGHDTPIGPMYTEYYIDTPAPPAQDIAAAKSLLARRTTIGVTSCYVDSIPVLVLTGNSHTHMAGRGVLQEIERRHDADLPDGAAGAI
jgi:hypothetical protein